MYNLFFKRILDLFFSILLSPIVILIIILIAPFIYLCDKGSIFYCANRIGQNGKIFKMIKFRTMIMDAPDIRLPDGSTYNSEDDPRMTPIGKILRASSIDETPQIFNIIMGDMSFIGPRPDPVDWLFKYSNEEKFFLTVKPGISGYNQAYYRNSADGALKLKNDILYARNISFILDVKIFLKTIKTVVLHENLYVYKYRKK